MRTSKLLSLFAAVAIATPILANADSVTFDFIGTVSSATGIYAALNSGTTVTGTYTFDFSNALPANSSGVLGSQTGMWTEGASGGTGSGTAVPNGYVFSSTATAGSFSYATAPIGTGFYSTSSHATGTAATALLVGSLSAGEVNNTGPNDNTGSAFGVHGLVPYTSAGLPNIDPTDENEMIGGSFESSLNGNSSVVVFSITSLTPVAPVPLPAAAWLLLSSLGGLGAFSRWRKTQIAVHVPIFM